MMLVGKSSNLYIIELYCLFGYTKPLISILKFKMRLLPLTFALIAPSEAALRFGCSTLSIQRLDPIVEPGRAPSAHLHQIVGGNAFNATMRGDVGEQGSCTTCTFSEDFSNYWTAVMFFKHSNGTFKRVPIMRTLLYPTASREE